MESLRTTVNTVFKLDVNPYLVSIKVNGTVMLSEIDTGACANVLSHKAH